MVGEGLVSSRVPGISPAARIRENLLVSPGESFIMGDTCPVHTPSHSRCLSPRLLGSANSLLGAFLG